MNLQHKNLASGRWQEMPFLEQMANIGSEVARTLSWKKKKNEEYSKLAFSRSLELFDLTLSADPPYPRRKEVARARELWVDYCVCDNQYQSTGASWSNYFNQLLIAYKNKM